MRARILYTNGLQTKDLFWLTHNGTDVYYGVTGFKHKTSYHASGKFHEDLNGERKNESWRLPLKEIVGTHHLTTMAFGNSKIQFSNTDPKYSYSGKKSDIVLTIDSRSIPENQLLNIMIGLVQPGQLNELNKILIPRDESSEAKQILVSTAVEPWIYVILTYLEYSE